MLPHLNLRFRLRQAILLLAVLSFPAAAIIFGADSAAANSPAPAIGRWDEAPNRGPQDDGMSPEEREALESLGYLAFSDVKSGNKLVSRYLPGAVQPGYTLIMSGHDFEANLINFEGEVKHRWHFRYDTLFPEREVRYNNMWFMGYVGEDGSLIIVQDGYGVFKLDKDSQLLWHFPAHAHHDLAVAADGSLYVLHSREAVVPEFDEEEAVIDNRITLLSPEGEEIKTVSILQALVAGGAEEVLEAARAWKGRRANDRLHTNAIEIIAKPSVETVPAFREGRLLLRSRSTSMIFLLDFEEEQVVWHMSGTFHLQHCPHLLDNGNILLFDNEGEDGNSVIREINPTTGDDDWAYRGSAQEPFYSRENGRCHPLPNGNTLIAESVGGRAFEITPSGEIVWEYWNPHRAGQNNDYIAPHLRSNSSA